MDNLLLPDEMLRQQICTLCSNYLSVGPVVVSREGEIICGRCSNQTHTGCTHSLFNLVAKKLVFKCINWHVGCNELLLFNEAIDHEKKCKKIKMKCPFQDFEGNGCQLIHHVRTKHQDVVIGDTFKIIFEQKLMKHVILVKNGNIFCLLINVIDKFVEIYSWLLTPGNRGSERFKLRFFKSDSNVEYVSPIIKITHELGNFVKLDTDSYQVKNRFVLDQASLVRCFSSTWSMCKVELIDDDCDMEQTILEKLYFMKIIDNMDTKLPANVSETKVAKDNSDKDLCPNHLAVCENGLDSKTSKCRVPDASNSNSESNSNIRIAVQHNLVWYDQYDNNESGAQYGDECGTQYDDQYNDQCGAQYEDECGAQYDYPYNNQCDDQYGAQYDDHDNQCGTQYDGQYNDHHNDQFIHCDDRYNNQHNDQCDVQYDDHYNDQYDDQHDNQWDGQCNDQVNDQCDVQYDDHYSDQYDDQHGNQWDGQCNDQHNDQCDVQYDDQCNDHYSDQYDDQHGSQWDSQCNDQHNDQCDVQYDDQCNDQYSDQYDNQCDDQYSDQCEVEYDNQHDNLCDDQYNDEHNDQYEFQYDDQYNDQHEYDAQCGAQYDNQYNDHGDYNQYDDYCYAQYDQYADHYA